MTMQQSDLRRRAQLILAAQYLRDDHRRAESILMGNRDKRAVDAVEAALSVDANLRATTNDAPVERLVEALHGALGEIEPAKRYAEECGLEGGKLPSAVHIKLDMIAAHIRDALAALSSPSGEPAIADEPVAWVSPGQFKSLRDPEYGEDGGAYLPVRKSPAGNFTMPLYAKPTPTDTADTPPASGLVEAATRVVEATNTSECFGGNVSWQEKIDNLRAALTAAPTAPVDREAAKQALRRWHRDTCYPDASDGELEIGLDAIVSLLPKIPEGGE